MTTSLIKQINEMLGDVNPEEVSTKLQVSTLLD
jgi:hypothetical protein